MELTIIMRSGQKFEFVVKNITREEIARLLKKDKFIFFGNVFLNVDEIESLTFE